LDIGDSAGAGQEFREILTQAHDRNLSSVALADGGLAALALRTHDSGAALQASAHALEVFDHVTGFRDVRTGPYLWRIRAEALLASGDATGAAEWGQRALDSLRRYDDPSSPDIAVAEATLRAASSAAHSKRAVH